MYYSTSCFSNNHQATEIRVVALASIPSGQCFQLIMCKPWIPLSCVVMHNTKDINSGSQFSQLGEGLLPHEMFSGISRWSQKLRTLSIGGKTVSIPQWHPMTQFHCPARMRVIHRPKQTGEWERKGKRERETESEWNKKPKTHLSLELHKWINNIRMIPGP